MAGPADGHFAEVEFGLDTLRLTATAQLADLEQITPWPDRTAGYVGSPHGLVQRLRDNEQE
ncbi:hypothetical protein ODJ79_42290 [Actinoplanes sp. KI2]|uniref:hypothetical protein n=1 Tax=Actinoplanes sp. KI2 TaxID=2983315 RepID=UPI0021D56C91|nr:hypothetical protein [Actinoplanes sp. KI2]MCU7730389.1 hypothetical protein [Actinoplanes sp. KI2]